MSTEREATLKLTTKVEGKNTLKEMGEAARIAADSEKKFQGELAKRIEQYKTAKRLSDDLTKALGLELSEEQKYQRALKDRLESYHVAARMKEDLAKAGIGRELSDEERYQRLFKERIKGMEQAKRMQRDLEASGHGPARMGMLGALKGAAGTFGLATSAIGIAKLISDIGLPHPEDFDEGHHSALLHRRRASKTAASLTSYIPFVGYAVEAERNRVGGELEGQRHVKEAGEAAQRAREDVSIKGPLQDRLRGLRGDLSEQQALLRYGHNTNAARFGVDRGALAFSEAAQASVFGRNAYDRSTQQQDIAQHVQFQSSRQQMGLEAQHQMSLLGAKEAQAGSEVAALRKQFAEAQGQVGAAGRNLGRNFKGTETQTVGEQRAEARQQMLAAQIRQEEARRQLMAAEERSLGVQQEKVQVMAQNQEKLQGLYKQQLTSLDGIVHAERQRRQSMTENIGLALPHEQQRMLHVARKIHGKQPLSLSDIGFARQHGDLFGPELQKIGAQRGAPIMAELQRLLPNLNAREKSAEAMRVQVQSQLQVKFAVDARQMADQTAAKVLPAFKEMMDQVAARITAEMDKQNILRKLIMGGAGK